jgi:hypothetical protein
MTILNKRILVGNSKKLAILKRDNYTCGYCGATGVELEIDHIKPVSKGGTNEQTNLITACKKCNRDKSDSEDWTPISKNNHFVYFWDTRREDYFEQEVKELKNTDILYGFFRISPKDILQKDFFAQELQIYDEFVPIKVVKLSLTDSQIMNIKYYDSFEEMNEDYAQYAYECNKKWTIENKPDWGFLPIERFYIYSVNKY